MTDYTRIQKAYVGFKSNGHADLLTDNMEVVNSGNEGAVNSATTCSVNEFSNGPLHQTVITLASHPVTVANTTGASFGSSKLYDFPAGVIKVLGAVASLGFVWTGEDIAATGSGDFSFGTTATSDATLSSTDVNLVPSTAMTDPFVAGVGAATGGHLAAATILDGHTTALDAYLNLIIDDADVADGASDTVLVSGTFRITWLQLGDY